MFIGFGLLASYYENDAERGGAIGHVAGGVSLGLACELLVGKGTHDLNMFVSGPTFWRIFVPLFWQDYHILNVGRCGSNRWM